MNSPVVPFLRQSNDADLSRPQARPETGRVISLRNPQQTEPQPQLIPQAQPNTVLPLEQVLRDQNSVDPRRLLDAIAMQARQDCSLGDVLLSRRWIRQYDLQRAEETRWDSQYINPLELPPDPRLIRQFGAGFCLKHGVLPWRRVGKNIVLLTSNPDQFHKVTQALPRGIGPLSMALAWRRDILDAIQSLHQPELVEKAETCVTPKESCRTWENGIFGRKTALTIIGFLTIGALHPALVTGLLFFWAILTLGAFTTLKLAASLAQYKHNRAKAQRDPFEPRTTLPARLPRVSILVPLFRESEITGSLVKRLARLHYPRELLEICLVAEEDDIITRDAIDNASLPAWIRPVVVPAGQLRTKPRALNFAMDFCTGSIIGVYDAEDEPDPDQIHKIVRRFHERGPEVVCLQGVLDYYNAKTNWLSRCFTIEYATWFRVVLPGIMRLGFAIPLGGTTLFFRRAALEKLGRWDAHNVTEDADLGIRLARHGYRAEIIHTVTREEANCRAIPWIKQRSRWLKGFAATWAVHMRDPHLLLKQLGPRRFLGFQIMFLCTLSQFVLAPLLWSLWLVPFGIAHPLNAILPDMAFIAMAALFILTELLSMLVAIFAVSSKEHRFLRWWVPTLPLYFPLGALASYKGVWELVVSPFYWDKTSHGHFAPAETTDTR